MVSGKDLDNKVISDRELAVMLSKKLPYPSFQAVSDDRASISARDGQTQPALAGQASRDSPQ
jgi:hypothetical protein